jgi:hypothetical protein
VLFTAPDVIRARVRFGSALRLVGKLRISYVPVFRSLLDATCLAVMCGAATVSFWGLETAEGSAVTLCMMEKG